MERTRIDQLQKQLFIRHVSEPGYWDFFSGLYLLAMCLQQILHSSIQQIMPDNSIRHNIANTATILLVVIFFSVIRERFVYPRIGKAVFSTDNRHRLNTGLVMIMGLICGALAVELVLGIRTAPDRLMSQLNIAGAICCFLLIVGGVLRSNLMYLIAVFTGFFFFSAHLTNYLWSMVIILSLIIGLAVLMLLAGGFRKEHLDDGIGGRMQRFVHNLITLTGSVGLLVLIWKIAQPASMQGIMSYLWQHPVLSLGSLNAIVFLITGIALYARRFYFYAILMEAAILLSCFVPHLHARFSVLIVAMVMMAGGVRQFIRFLHTYPRLALEDAPDEQ